MIYSRNCIKPYNTQVCKFCGHVEKTLLGIRIIMKDIGLTPLEQQILDQSDIPEITRRRRTIVIVSGLSFAAVLIAMALLKRSWQFVLGIALLYIAITVWEKVAYANAVLAYKNLIQKLKTEIEAKEPSESSQQQN